MPQMNPMNWLLLLLFFNSILGMVAVKVHFLYKESLFESTTVSASDSPSMVLKI